MIHLECNFIHPWIILAMGDLLIDQPLRGEVIAEKIGVSKVGICKTAPTHG